MAWFFNGFLLHSFSISLSPIFWIMCRYLLAFQNITFGAQGDDSVGKNAFWVIMRPRKDVTSHIWCWGDCLLCNSEDVISNPKLPHAFWLAIAAHLRSNLGRLGQANHRACRLLRPAMFVFDWDSSPFHKVEKWLMEDYSTLTLACHLHVYPHTCVLMHARVTAHAHRGAQHTSTWK